MIRVLAGVVFLCAALMSRAEEHPVRAKRLRNRFSKWLERWQTLVGAFVSLIAVVVAAFTLWDQSKKNAMDLKFAQYSIVSTRLADLEECHTAVMGTFEPEANFPILTSSLLLLSMSDAQDDTVQKMKDGVEAFSKSLTLMDDKCKRVRGAAREHLNGSSILGRILITRANDGIPRLVDMVRYRRSLRGEEMQDNHILQMNDRKEQLIKNEQASIRSDFTKEFLRASNEVTKTYSIYMKRFRTLETDLSSSDLQ